VFAAPTLVASVTPTKGPSTGGTNLIITGSGFTDYSPVAPANFAYSGSCQTYTAPSTGSYKLETWGAQGGSAGTFAGGRGGYSTGVVRLTAGTTVHVCVGGQGSESARTTTAPYPGGFNGGGGSARSNNGKNKETASGGGATDIRIGTNSLYSRVVVAGGGGGAIGEQFGPSIGGAGGGTSGITMPDPGKVGSDTPGNGGTQTAGGANTIACSGSGFFGSAGVPCGVGVTDRSGGGGGWFGGGAGITGGGGSGFIFTGASDVSAATIGGTYLLGQNYYLSSAETIDGENNAPAPTGGTQRGQLGNGYARITRLPYDVTIDGIGCDNIEILSDTQLTCTAPAHPAGPADVEVTIGESTGRLAGGYTYTDALSITGPDNIMARGNAEYEIRLNAPYTGVVTLDDGGIGGTWSGPGIINGNQISFSNSSSIRVIYTPPISFGGDITLSAKSGVDYVTNASKLVSLSAATYTFTCSDGMGGQTSKAFVIPGTALDCEVRLDGPYEGTISFQDIIIGTGGSLLGGVFASADTRFAGDVWTTTYSDTDDEPGRVLILTYTSPIWSELLDISDGLAEGNKHNAFWPTLTTTSSPVLLSTQSAVSAGLLAQSYEIIQTDAIFSCLGCRTRFYISTYGAPYFGQIVLSGDMDGTFNDGQTTLTFSYNGDGSHKTFTYKPNELGWHTISGVSSVPAITDADITFEVVNSHITITCDPIYLARGQTTDCTMSLIITDSDKPGIDIELQDIFLGLTETNGDGVFVDTTSAPNTGTFSGSMYQFCGGSSNPLIAGEDCDDPGETYTRTFTYTLPLGTSDDFSEIRIQASSEDYIPAETSWQLLNIIADTMILECSAAFPDCQVGHVGMPQDYTIRPNGVFSGKVKLSDGDPNSIFSDKGIASWSGNGDSFLFSYTPSSPGIKTLTAEVIEITDPNTDIQIGDTYTLEVVVYANIISIYGPDFVALDYQWDYYRYGITLNGPYEGAVNFSLYRRDGAIETILMPDQFLLIGDNIVDNHDGTYSCVVDLTMYDPITNTTTACSADNGGGDGTFAGFNYFEIHANSDYDTYIAEATKTVGIVAGIVYDFTEWWSPVLVSAGYDVLFGGIDATTDTIITTVGTPLNFVTQPNALFAGTYTASIDSGVGLLSADALSVSSGSWPAINDQTLQTQNFVFTPTGTGYMTLTFSADRFGTGSLNDPAHFYTRTVNLLVLADSAMITGPDSIINGSTETFTLTIPGPFIGTFHIDESSTPDLESNKLSPTSCTFDIGDYNEITNTTSCDFTFSSDPDQYTNYVTLFASSGSVSATHTFDIIADGYTVIQDYTVLGTEYEINAKINNPITFTITPNAQYDGEFTITQKLCTAYNEILRTCTGSFVETDTGILSKSSIPYSYSEYDTLSVDQPLPKTFTFTPTRFGITILTISGDPDLGGDTEFVLSVFDWPVIGGPDTIQRCDGGVSCAPNYTVTSIEYTVSVLGPFNGLIDLTIHDKFTLAEIPAATATIVTNKGGTSCDFDPTERDPETDINLCTFTFYLPASFTGNYITIRSNDPNSAVSELVADYHDVAVVASAFTVSPSSVLDATIDEALTFEILPNALYDGTFTLDAPNNGPFSERSVTFTHADWPADQDPMPGKQFSYTPQNYGYNNIEVCSVDLGCQTITILVLADTMSLTGTSTIQRGPVMTGTYTLSIPGPYEGRINFALTDTAAGSIGGSTFSNSGFCIFDTTDFDEVTNTTSCTFTLNLPANLNPTKHIQITATTDMGSRTLPTTSVVTAITASAYNDLGPARIVAGLGEDVPIDLTPNAVANSSFNISTDGTSHLSTAAVGFVNADYPLASNLDVTKTFVVTTRTPGIETITVTSPLGTKQIEILTLASKIEIVGQDRIKQGTTSEDFSVVINGPYEGTATITHFLPDGASTLPATGITLSTSSCTFTFSDYDEITNTTSCSFVVSVPLAYHANWLNIEVEAPGLSADPLVALTADDFDFTSGAVLANTGTPIVFTITPNSVFHGTFTLDDGGMGGIFSPTSLVFSDTTWPYDTLEQGIPVGLDFTYIPRKPGDITITACNLDLGCKEIDIVATGEDLTRDIDTPDTGWFSRSTGAAVASSSGLIIICAAAALFAVSKRSKKR